MAGGEREREKEKEKERGRVGGRDKDVVRQKDDENIYNVNEK